MTKSIFVRGQKITGSTFSADFKAVKSAAQKMGRMLEAGGKYATLYNNFDWLNRLFSSESPLVKKDGSLSEDGKKAKAFVTFHVPAVKIEKDEAGEWKTAFTKSDKFRGSFVTDVNDEGEKQYASEGDFYFTFEDWKNRGKKKSTKAPKASQTTRALEKALEAWETLEGSAEDFAALEALADKINKAANARKAALVAEMAQTVDADMSQWANEAKPQASKRADTDRQAASA